jgi:hypothetical protein
MTLVSLRAASFMPIGVRSNKPLIPRRLDAADLKSEAIASRLRHLFGAHKHQKCAVAVRDLTLVTKHAPPQPIGGTRPILGRAGGLLTYTSERLLPGNSGGYADRLQLAGLGHIVDDRVNASVACAASLRPSGPSALSSRSPQPVQHPGSSSLRLDVCSLRSTCYEQSLRRYLPR